MSRKYQGLIVLNTKSNTGSIDELVGTVSEAFKAEGAKIEKVTQLGRRTFAYASRHLDAGHFVSYAFDGSPESVAKIQSRLRLNTTVHVQHFTRVA